MIITLPWPDKRLSPNARLHWRAKVGPKQAAKIAAGHLAYAASRGFQGALDAMRASDEPIPVTITFYPPDRRHRDDDNMIGSFKAARDGIADALGINDRRFRPHYYFEEAEKPGRVVVCFPAVIPNNGYSGSDYGFPESSEVPTLSGPETMLATSPRPISETLSRSETDAA